MTDQERLQEIKRAAKAVFEQDKAVSPNVEQDEIAMEWHKDMNWLIEQAERFETLERENDWFRQKVVEMKADEVLLRKQNQRYKQALEGVWLELHLSRHDSASRVFAIVDDALKGESE